MIIQEYRYYKIKNGTILIGMVVGVIYQSYQLGVSGIWNWFLAFSCSILILFFLFLFRVLGAGDIKVFAVLGGIFGFPYILSNIVLSFILGSIYAFIFLLVTKQFYSRFHYFIQYISNLLYSRQVVPYYVPSRDGTTCVIHFSYAIAGSVVLLYFFPNMISNLIMR